MISRRRILRADLQSIRRIQMRTLERPWTREGISKRNHYPKKKRKKTWSM